MHTTPTPLDIAAIRALPTESLEDFLTQVAQRAESYDDPAIWIYRLTQTQVIAQLNAALARKKTGAPLPLLGVPFAVKDNIDVANFPTTAACPAFAYDATRTATAVQKLLDAGAILIGKTNLDQFATGLVGVRSPFGAAKNPFNRDYISGGSSSGSAVAVSAGLVSFSLGTDTAGSGRVPAAFNNIVGFKPTRGIVSTAGVVPACQSLDCVSIFARSCDDAQTIFNLAAGYDASDAYSRSAADLSPADPIPLHHFRFGVPRASDLNFFGNDRVEKIFYDAIERLKSLGGVSVEIDYSPFAQAAAMLYDGPWVAERTFAAEKLLRENPDAIFPITRTIFEKGKSISAADTFRAMHRLESLKQLARAELSKVDFLVLPTAATCYTIAQVQADPIALNSNLGLYTNFANLLDLCAIAVPAGFDAQTNIPNGVTLFAKANQDAEIFAVGDALHRTLNIGTGVAKAPLPPATKRTSTTIKLAVVGAHLSGLPLNRQLTDRRAQLVRATKTAPLYKFYALPGTVPPKPGLVRVESGGASIELEIWEMSAAAFGSFVAAIPSPLGIGTIQLEDGTSVQGFLCESVAVTGAPDISHFGGWRAYMKSK